MFTVILLAIGLGLALYVNTAKTKGALKWSGRGVAGVAKELQNQRNKAQLALLEDPDTEQKTIDYLDQNVVNTTQYYRESSKRAKVSYTSLADALAINEAAANQETK